MKQQVQKEWDVLLTNYSQLSVCVDDIWAAFVLLKNVCRKGGLIMICGNGGSAADAGHITGELMKSFKLKRPLTGDQREALVSSFPDEATYFADHLQRGIRAISLAGQAAFSSAFINDVAPDMVFAQQVFGYGSIGDVLWAISTSGNSTNVVNACKIARAFGIGTIGMTGEHGGQLVEICNVTIRVPACKTFRVQEYHLPVYHTLCAMLEAELFS